jgi:hypothetical protein
VDDVDIAAPDAFEGARLVLAVLELPLLVTRERRAQLAGDALPEIAAGVQGK